MKNNSPKYKIRYHHIILKKDIPELNRDILLRIKSAIEKRLMEEPAKYGLPLRKTLKGYWKLRIGDYRVVYQITGNEIHVLTISHRSKVYRIALKRK